MRFLEAGIDAAVIALWLGHESIATTSMYLHADLNIKRAALDAPGNSTRRPVTITPRTRCSPGSRACDYADDPPAGPRQPIPGRLSA